MNRIMKATSLALSTGAIVLAVAAVSTGAMAARQEEAHHARQDGRVHHRRLSQGPSTPPTPNRTLSCDHGYVEYFIPSEPRKTSIVLWHSSSAQVWQNRWDGGEGYKDKMLRADYPTYIWDGPRVGRANWSCEAITTTPSARDQGNFTAWDFGPAIPAGQVPTAAEFCARLAVPGQQSEARGVLVERDRRSLRGVRYRSEYRTSRRMRQPSRPTPAGSASSIVYLTNSAGGLRSMVTTSKTTGKNIAGIVTYESIGYVFPLTTSGAAASLPKPATLCDMSGAGCAFGPIGIPEEDFKKLAKLKKIQFVWGDNRPETYTYVIQSRQCAALINAYGGNAEVVKLGDPFAGGLHGKHAYPVRRHGQRQGRGLALQAPEEEQARRLRGSNDHDDDDDDHHH